MSVVRREQLVEKGVTMKSHGGLNASQRFGCSSSSAMAPLPQLSSAAAQTCCLLLVVHAAQPAPSVPLPAESTACAELAPSGRGVLVPALGMQSPTTKG